MLKKVMICSTCLSQSCDGNEWEIVPTDPSFLSYSSAVPGARKWEDWEICTSMIDQDAEVPEFTIVVGHGVIFIVKVRRKSKGKKK